MIELAERKLCTGCGACAFVCHKRCITLKEDAIGAVYPNVDDANCVQCGACQKVCPILNPVSYNMPRKAYAAWSSDGEERRTSASGGVSMEIYKEALQSGKWVAGAKSNEDFSVSLSLSDQPEDLPLFKNSKYVFSSATDLYGQLKNLLQQGGRAVVIGLPCQIAAVRKIFSQGGDLLLVDMVCHGATPYSYLAQHIRKLEEELGDVATRMSFRDPYTYTYTFTFTLYNSKGRCFYAQRIKDGDTYQYAYHRMVSYRENCYHCAFARTERVSDITLKDYSGLGKLVPCSYDGHNVSAVLVNTDKGMETVENLISSQRIVAEERPVEEVVMGDPRLQLPSHKTSARLHFERRIVKENGDFEKAIKPVMANVIRKERLRKIYTMPQRVIEKIIKMMK